MHQRYALFLAPPNEMPAGELRSVVAPKRLWSAAFRDYVFEGPANPLTGEAGIHFNSRAFPGKTVDHSQHSQAPACCQRIADKIESPFLVGSRKMRIHRRPAY